MANPFANVQKAANVEKDVDRVGGFQLFESDIYEATIKALYTSKSASSNSMAVNLIADIGGREFTKQIWVTDKDGKNYYTKDDKNHFLPGWNHANALALCATGKGLDELAVEDKTFNVWDQDARKALPKSVPTFIETLGAKVYLAILKQKVDKFGKNSSTNKYDVVTGETREENDLDKVFEINTKLTVTEAEDGQTEPKFFQQWLDANKGKTRNKAKHEGAAASGGTSGRPAGAPPAAGASNKPSLFGGKK